MSKDVGQAHGLHQLMRSWLLSEDPYGVNQRIEPTMGTPAPASAAPPPRSPTAQAEGEGAVENALAPDPRGETAGPDAVAQQLFGGQGARYSEAERDPRGQAWGEHAVGQSTATSPTAEVDRTRGQMWGENAVDKALNPPMGGGSGFWGPGEAADTAGAVGQQAVEGALAKKARGRIARGSPMFAPARTSDPSMPRQQTRARTPGKSEQDDTPSE